MGKKRGTGVWIAAILVFILLALLTKDYLAAYDVGYEDGIYKPQWAGIECHSFSNDPSIGRGYGENVYTYATPYPTRYSLIYLSNDFDCEWFGGCTLTLSNVQIAGDVGCSITTAGARVGYGQRMKSGTIVGGFSCFVPAIFASADTLIYPTQPHKLKIVSGPATIRKGWLDDTLNCELAQAPLDIRKQLEKESPTTDVPEIEDEVENAVVPFTDLQIPPGQTFHYVADWSAESAYGVVSPLGKYNGKDVRCVPREGLYEAKRIPLKSGNAVYIQGDLLVGWGSGGVTCCGYSGECGEGYICKNYVCRPKTSEDEYGDCGPLFASEEICLWDEKRYYKTVCRDDKIVEIDLGTPKCCPGVGVCDWDEICVPLEGCMSKKALKDVPEGFCTIDGQTTTGETKLRPSDSQYKIKECPADKICCYNSQQSEIGACQMTCVGTTPQLPNSEQSKGDCEKMGPLGDLLHAWGLSCDIWGIVILAIFGIILLLVMVVIFKVFGFFMGMGRSISGGKQRPGWA